MRQTEERPIIGSDNHRRLIDVQPVPKQKPEDRIENWNKAYLGYTLEGAVVEAERCIHCPTAPCQEGLPHRLGQSICLYFLKRATSTAPPRLLP